MHRAVPFVEVSKAMLAQRFLVLCNNFTASKVVEALPAVCAGGRAAPPDPPGLSGTRGQPEISQLAFKTFKIKFRVEPSPV